MKEVKKSRSGFFAPALICAVVVLCGFGVVASAAAAESEEGFVSLFDGKTTKGWRNFKGTEDQVKGWTVEDGSMKGDGHGGDLITVGQFADFELRFEWKISQNGNSGVIYRSTEDEQYSFQTGPEYQVLDDEKRGGKVRNSAASLYGLYPPKGKTLKPAGQYNTARIILKGNRVEHWLNGKKVVECKIGSQDWNDRVAKSKFRKWKKYGTKKKGHIALQGHGSPVWYRNIRIKDLSPK